MPRTAVILEDDVGLRYALSGLLASFDYTVFPVATAQDAMACFNHDDIGVFLADVLIGGEPSGLDIAGAVRVRWPSTRIFLMSSDHLLASQAEPLEFLPKPVDLSALQRIAET